MKKTSKFLLITVLSIFIAVIQNSCEKKPTLPSVTTVSVSAITRTTAASGGNVTDDGGAEVTTRGVCWCENENPTIINNNTIDGSGTGSFTSSLASLTPGTNYYVRAYAINSAGTAYGNQVSFTTQDIQLPLLTTSDVTSVTETTAVSGGNITDDGGGQITARGVCWSTTENPTTSDNTTTDGTGLGSFTSNLTGLSPATTYYVRAYATNNAGIAYGNEVTFATNIAIPDHNFLNALLEKGVDIDGDNFINPVEAQAITFLDVSEKNISDMTGIEEFINLDTLNCCLNQITTLDVSNNTALLMLDCHRNQLTGLDVSNNTALEYLYCSSNQLTTLDVSNNTALEYLLSCSNQLTTLDVTNNTALLKLDCHNNQITSLDVLNNTALLELYCRQNQFTNLDVTSNTALEFLSCGGNQLTTLNVTNNTALEYLFCDYNQITTLDVSSNTALIHFACRENQLTTLDVASNTALEILQCGENQLTTLDVSNNTALQILQCFDNQLTTLDISNNTALEYIGLSDMPTLFQVCVWVIPFPPAGVSCDTTGSPSVYFTTECSK